ncbi:DUF342 domain-containing protein [Selenomonas sp. F0473]|uniref:DUF342 domain-containing protein n=1 Tax=Selenomonas sp. F0473 TaxID=999423 RepID=UPI00029E1CEF|nr:FapA family protein [Selenomonas sp. F0473]EKU70685.1 hypothetical protein HMPREF9161_01731 [Selenomonas sp. F0473]
MDKTVGSRHEGYLLALRTDGNYLTIYPEDEGGAIVELADIRKYLEAAGVTDYDVLQVARIIRVADGTETKLDPAPPEDVADEANKPVPFGIEIARDAMSVTVRFDEKQGNIPPSTSDILAALAEKGIVYGIDREAISRGVARMNTFVAARGTAPEAGTDARIEKKFDMGEKGRPAARAYDRVDYKDMNIFIRTQTGDVLAVRIPETPGVPGKNVLGEEVAPKPGKPAQLPQGKNTKVVNDHELVAMIDGQIVDDGKISVDPHLVIDKSVDVGTGNVDFAGSIEIRGDVESGFTVKAAGDVEIKGMVGGAEVTGRNVIVHGGIRGMNVGKIHAEEDVSISFVENANISAGRDIFVNDVVLHSEVRAGHHLRVEGKRGIITGGSVGAGESIQASVLGNSFYVQTNLLVGIDPNLQHNYEALEKECKEDERRLTEIKLSLETLKKQDLSKLSDKRKEQMLQLTKVQFPLAGKIKQMREDLAAMRAELDEMKQGSVSASDTIFPGVSITINGIKRKVEEELRHTKMRVVDGEVVTSIL